MTRATLADTWRPYTPNPSAPWNLERVVHLHRRSGFGASPAELRRDLEEGHDASLMRILEGRVRAAPRDFDSLQKGLAARAVYRSDPRSLQAWWVLRMLVGPDPLRERLTLLWHDHFATSQLKVGDLGLMRRQNEVFRAEALAPFGRLLERSVKEPALLLWLDAETNRKGHPNENLARELMELFTLGIGNYTERDVKEAARALTGWTVRESAFVDRDVRHDTGEKEILGKMGRWTGDDLLQILLEHPATAERLARKLVREFLGEQVAGQAALDALARGLQERSLDLSWAVETILRSELFFSEETRGLRVVGPAEFVVGTVRALDLADPLPSTLVLAHWLVRAGLDLFYPPNVGGWAGGLAWLAPRELVARANFARALLSGQGTGRPGVDERTLERSLSPLLEHREPEDVLSILLTGQPYQGQQVPDVVPAGSKQPGRRLCELASAFLSGPQAHLT